MKILDWKILMAVVFVAGLMNYRLHADADQPGPARDLQPVTFHKAPTHAPVQLVKDGKALGSIYVMHPGMKASMPIHLASPSDAALLHLQDFIKLATGVELPIVHSPNKLIPPAIVIGNCDAAAAEGLVGTEMPTEGFAIKTTKDFVFIVGNDGKDPSKKGPYHGTAWGITEFLERYLDVRWYFFNKEIGLSVPKRDSLTIPAVHLTDAPAFIKRRVRPKAVRANVGYGLCTYFNRCNNGLPQDLVFSIVNNWGKVDEFRKERPEIFQLNADGNRDTVMLCYGNPKTLETHLDQIESQLARIKEKRRPTKADRVRDLMIVGDVIAVAPHYSQDIECVCKDCRKLWDSSARADGTASRIVSSFIAKLATEVKKRWPDMKVCFGPYNNYFAAPKDIDFPDNVYLHLMYKPGLALCAQPVHGQRLRADIDQWYKLTGHKMQFTDYCRWPGETTRAPFQYPHALQKHYKACRDTVIGTQIDTSKFYFTFWDIQTISTYVWLRLLWDPDINVDATIDAFTTRMFGPAAATMRQLVQLQMDGWEKATWPSELMGAQAIYEAGYPRKVVLQMEGLLMQAKKQAAGNELVSKRIEFYAQPFAAFFKCSIQT